MFYLIKFIIKRRLLPCRPVRRFNRKLAPILCEDFFRLCIKLTVLEFIAKNLQCILKRYYLLVEVCSSTCVKFGLHKGLKKNKSSVTHASQRLNESFIQIRLVVFEIRANIQIDRQKNSLKIIESCSVTIYIYITPSNFEIDIFNVFSFS